MEHSEELAKQIRSRIAELEADLEAHRRALAVLVQPSAPTPPAPNGRQRRPAGAPQRARSEPEAERAPASTATVAKPKRGRRPVVSAEAVFDALTDGNDQAALIAKEFGVSTTVVRHRLEQLERAGRATKSGERRGTRWRSNAAS